MPDVVYVHQLPYLVGSDDRSFPGLLVQVRHPEGPDAAVDVSAHLDTGTECSLFGGWIATALELNLLDGEPVTFTSTGGVAIEARKHNVILSHDVLGDFELPVAFSLGEIRRNLIGRDFFAVVQIGFREAQLEFYVTPAP